jgi:hypothetical protein
MAGLLTAPDPVAETLRRWASEPFVWGTSDCALSVLDYVEKVSGRTIRRPQYGSANGALRIMQKEPGGFRKLAWNTVANLGGRLTDAPVRGDVGLVELVDIGLTACLCVGPDRWAARGHHEVVIVTGGAVMAWSVGGAPCPRP